MDSMIFRDPIYVGNVVTLDAELSYVGTTSMEVMVEVVAENVLTGIHTRTNTAYLVFVAIDAQGRPQRVPPLIATTEEERIRMEEARERQVYLTRQSQSAKHAQDRRTASRMPD